MDLKAPLNRTALMVAQAVRLGAEEPPSIITLNTLFSLLLKIYSPKHIFTKKGKER